MQKVVNLVNTFRLFFPHPVLLLAKKVFLTLSSLCLFYANFMHLYAFFCAYFSEAKSTLVLINTLFACVCERRYTKSSLSPAVDLISEF